MEIQFEQFFDAEGFDGLKVHAEDLSKIMQKMSTDEGQTLGWINAIVLPTEQHNELNSRYLGHDYATDVLTFEFSEKDVINGEIYIDAEILREQAEEYGVELDEEYKRLLVHGVLHLLGYDDGTDLEKGVMREKEDHYLELLR